MVELLITKLRKVYCWVWAKKSLKSVNIWQSYKQECGCLMHFAHLANTLLKDEESTETIALLLVILPNIYWAKKNSLTDSAINAVIISQKCMRMWPTVTDVPWSVCLSVCTAQCAGRTDNWQALQTTKQIEVLWGLWSVAWVHQRNHIINR